LSNATTGSDRVIPDKQPPQEERGPRLARLTRPAVRTGNSPWLAAAVVIRIIVILGYPPILWFNDSYNYIYDAVSHVPDVVRPNGYPFFIDLLLPLHSAYPLAILQAAMGVAMGVLIYALLRRRGLPWWGATLAALPVLFDSYQLHLEHMITADTLFIFLGTVAIVILCWNDRPSVPVMAVAGLLIGYATLVRSVGQPCSGGSGGHAGQAGGLAAPGDPARGGRRAHRGVHGLVQRPHGRFGLTESSGTFLYSRVSRSPNVTRSNLRPTSAPCGPDAAVPAPGVGGVPVGGQRERGRTTRSPPRCSTCTTPPTTDSGSRRRSTRWRRSSPGRPSWLSRSATCTSVVNDTLHTFGWNRQPDPNNYYGNGPAFQFVSGKELNALIPWWVNPVRGDAAANGIYRARQEFGGPGSGRRRRCSPGSTAPGIPAVHLPARHAARPDRAHRRGRRGGPLAPLGRHRPAALAGGGADDRAAADDRRVQLPVRARRHTRRLPGRRLALARRPGDKSVGARAADLRRHLRRGGAVDQE
jgi:hypothetical protein